MLHFYTIWKHQETGGKFEYDRLVIHGNKLQFKSQVWVRVIQTTHRNKSSVETSLWWLYQVFDGYKLLLEFTNSIEFHGNIKFSDWVDYSLV